MTAWTFANDVTVGKEFACHLVAVLLFCYLLQSTLVIERLEEVTGKLIVCLARSA